MDRRKTARETFDRRKERILSAVITGDLAKGWLVFSTMLERRRYAPVPDQWTTASDAELLHWCEAAKPLPPTRRLIE
jgi:hypothetical protein